MGEGCHFLTLSFSWSRGSRKKRGLPRLMRNFNDSAATVNVIGYMMWRYFSFSLHQRFNNVRQVSRRKRQQFIELIFKETFQIINRAKLLASNCGFFLENQRQFFQFCNVLSILINDLLPSFRQHRNPTFIKLLVFISKKLNQVRFDIIIVIEIFTIRGVL